MICLILHYNFMKKPWRPRTGYVETQCHELKLLKADDMAGQNRSTTHPEQNCLDIFNGAAICQITKLNFGETPQDMN